MFLDDFILSDFPGNSKQINENKFQEENSKKIKEFLISNKSSFYNYLTKELSNDFSFVLYKVYLSTGDQLDAGTSCSIYLSFIGDFIISKFQLLVQRNQVNETLLRGSTKKFFVTGPKLKKLNFILIYFENKNTNDSWFLKSVRIEEVQSDNIWYCECNKWFSKVKEDCMTYRIFETHKSSLRIIKFDLTVKIVNSSIETFKLPFYIKLFGSVRNSKRIVLGGNPIISKKEFYSFVMHSYDVGNIKKIRIGISDDRGNNSPKPQVNILIEEITIKSCQKNSVLSFVNSKEIILQGNKTDSNNILDLSCNSRYRYPNLSSCNLCLNTHPNKENVFYDIMIWKQDSPFLKKLSTIFIQLFGQTRTWSPVYEITDKKSFSKKEVKVFRVFGKNVGSIKRIRMWHDKAGMASAWHLDKVNIVRQLTSREIYLTISTMKKQGKLHPAIDICDGRIIIKTNISQNRFSSKTSEKIVEAGDNNDTYLHEYKIRPIKKPIDSFSLPYAEESTFVCQAWLSVEGDRTVPRQLPVNQKKIISSTVKLRFK